MQIPTAIIKQSRHLLLTATIMLLVACGSNVQQQEAAVTEDGDIPITLEAITAMLEKADQLENSERAAIYMDVTQALLRAEEVDWARNTLAQLGSTTLSPPQILRYTVLSAKLTIAQGQPFVAKRLLWEPEIIQFAQQASVAERIDYHDTRATLLASLAEYRASIDERIALHSLIEAGGEEDERNQDLLWQTLMELPFVDLKMESQIRDDMLTKGWYSLAALSKDNQTNMRLQIEAVERWMFAWPEHPASLRLPADLQLLKQLVENQPRRIAILLPLSGRFEAASTAIRDGIMAAYYDSASSEETIPDLRIYDSAQGDINTLYDDAVLAGAQLIIGPLEQKKIAELALRPELPVPVLALNRLSGPLDSTEGLFQFGLPLEDEAEQVAVQAWADGHRRAMILAPATGNGDRSVKSFSDKWLELGGEIINDYRYNAQSEYSDLIKDAVKIQDSENRRNQVRSIIGKSVEFEPRRRKDIDFIFLYSQASQARQLKPILAYHYAGDVPVYAIKDIYSGTLDRKLDKDLNEIRFTTLPWFFDDSLPEKRAIRQYSRSTRYQFLYALGIDAYHLYPRLRQLKEVKQAHFYGATGKLRLDEDYKIRREQIWAKFVQGEAVQVATFSSEDDL